MLPTTIMALLIQTHLPLARLLHLQLPPNPLALMELMLTLAAMAPPIPVPRTAMARVLVLIILAMAPRTMELPPNLLRLLVPVVREFRTLKPLQLVPTPTTTVAGSSSSHLLLPPRLENPSLANPRLANPRTVKPRTARPRTAALPTVAQERVQETLHHVLLKLPSLSP